MRSFKEATTSHTATASNDIATVTLAAVAGLKRHIHNIVWSYDGDPTGGRVYVNFGSDLVFDVDVTKGGPGDLPHVDLVAPVNTAVTVNLAAGGAGVVGNINVVEYEPDILVNV